jgi:hypothetical protein
VESELFPKKKIEICVTLEKNIISQLKNNKINKTGPKIRKVSSVIKCQKSWALNVELAPLLLWCVFCV